MLPIIRHYKKCKAEILSREGQHLISKTPVVIIAKNGQSSTTIDIKTAATFHGQISRDANGEVDLVAEMSKHPDSLWIRVKAIEADAPNDNGDYFSREEIIKAYKTFEGCPVFTNHENNKVEHAKGKVVKAEWDDREGSVYCTMYVDRKANPSLCRAIEEGYVTDVSMGTQVDFSTCSVCEKKAYTAEDYCPHVKTMKGRVVDGGKVFEKNYGLKFIEISVVTDGACKDCTIRDIIDPNEFLTKVATSINVLNKIIKSGGMLKDGGQAELQKMNQAMDLLEDVTRTMLDQRQYIDLEFAKNVMEVLADLQHVNDELVDQGYGRIGDQAQAGQQMGVPPIPENSMNQMQEQPSEAPKPFLSGPSNMGVGTVTEPATASSGGKVLLSARIKELQERVAKIYEEAETKKLSRSGGITSAMDKEKANQTKAKLAKIWENPSIRNFRTEVSEGDFTVVVGTQDIWGLRGGNKVASLKITNLESDVQQELQENPTKCAEYLIQALKDTFSKNAPLKMEKEAAYTPTDTKEQQEQTFESQLENQKPPLHPREKEMRESITEDQLRKTREGYDYHARTEETRDSITEKQLNDGGYQGYDYHKRQDQPRDETIELQIRNTKWQGNVTPADHKGEWVAGVTDQNQQITEGQLEDWKKADKRHLPTDRITEKQLAQDAENWGRRIASKEDAMKAKTAAFKALAKTSIATGATPEEMLSFIADFNSTPKNSLAAEKAVESLSKHKESRLAMLNRAKFHGAGSTFTRKNAAMDYLLGAMSDEGMSGEVARETLQVISEQKNVSKLISEAIALEKLEEKSEKSASSKDLLREAMAENAADEISIILDKSAIKVDEKDAEKFAAAAYEAAIKVAEKSGLKITEKVHVASRDNGKVEVAMLGVKAKEETKVVEAEKKESVEKPDAATLAARKEDRKQIVAQMGGAMPGGDMAGGAAGGMPGPGGGTTMPPPPGGAAADPTAIPPVAGLADQGMGEEDEGTGEALPPGSICPVCGAEDVDIRHGEFTCNECGAAGDFEVEIHIREYPGVIEDTEPKDDDSGMEEGGIGDMGGGAGMEMGGMGGAGMPAVGVAASFKVTPEMIKIANGKPIGTFCPHCGSNKTKLAMKKGAGKGTCESCSGTYSIETLVDVSNKSLGARIAWTDMQVTKLAAQKFKQQKLAKQAEKEMSQKKIALTQALRKSGLSGKFAKADVSGKAAIIAKFADQGLLDK